MKNNELEAKLTEAINKIEDEFDYYGLRFENKDRSIGEIITDFSKHNPEREDERDFPEYDSNAYASLPTLDGVSAWEIVLGSKWSDWKKSFLYGWNNNMDFSGDAKYAYIIAGNNNRTHDDCDENEIVLLNPVVIAKVQI